MRILLIHAEKFSYRVRERALSGVPEPSPESESYSDKNVLVVFTSVEKWDMPDREYLENIVRDVLEVAKKVKAECIVLYPYAHLSPDLAKPERARLVFAQLEDILRRECAKSNLRFHAAPFGYYKEFELKCYGHPLSELSRTYKPHKVRVGEPETPEPTRNFYVIVTPDGRIVSPQEYTFRESERDLEILVRKEVFKEELPGGQEPRYLYYCKKFGFEWEPLSDYGHMRFGPEATIMYELVERYSWLVAKRLGIPILKVRGTNMFRLSAEPVYQHARLFGERMYVIETEDDKLVLRYAACFQQFSMVRDWVISYRDLPLAVMELADSYRYEQPGETALCFRLRKFTMPDTHIFTRDLEEAKTLCFRVHDIIYDEIRKIGLDYVALWNVTRDFYESNLDYLREYARREGKPILVNVIEGRRYYWVLNVEFNIVDELERPREIATMQIDVGNAERFGITYRAPDGSSRHPVIIHTALIGSIERYIYALLQRAALDEKEGKIPRLPTWICPIQVRLVPVSREHVEHCDEIADIIEARGIRVDVDDRDEPVGKRIREAEKLWIPYIVVIGREEISSKVLSVRIRGERQLRKMSIDDLLALIERELEGYPRIELTLPRRVSMRPMYRPLV